MSQRLLSSNHSLPRAPHVGMPAGGVCRRAGSLPTPTGHGDRAFTPGQGVRPIARSRSDHRRKFPTTSGDLRQVTTALHPARFRWPTSSPRDVRASGDAQTDASGTQPSGQGDRVRHLVDGLPARSVVVRGPYTTPDGTRVSCVRGAIRHDRLTGLGSVPLWLSSREWRG